MSPLLKLIHTRTPKFYFMNKVMKNRDFTLLDLGAGNGSPSRTTALFPKCTYHGLDLDYSYNYSPGDIAAIAKFYEADLSQSPLSEIPDNSCDYINMAHIIEHLPNGEQVIARIAPKLREGGFIYIEYPGARSTRLPSMPGSLNFYDDPTHVRVYSVAVLAQALEQSGFAVIASGTRRSWFHILTMPARAVHYLLRDRKVYGSVFWDMLGFAEYVFARKIS